MEELWDLVVSVETTLEFRASSLRHVEGMRPLFTQERVAASAGQFSTGRGAESGAKRAEAARGTSGVARPNG